MEFRTAFVVGVAFGFGADARAQQPWIHVEDSKLVGAGVDTGDRFGSDLALDGDTLVVGAPGAGVNERGEAYVYVRAANGWTEQARLASGVSALADFDHFGAAVALHRDYAVVGAPDSGASNRGAVYVFRRSGAAWSFDAALAWPQPFNNERFGYAVAIRDSTIAVGAPDRPGNGPEGAVGVFTNSSGAWTFRRRLQNSFADDDDQLGRALDIQATAPGQYQIIAACLTGSAVVYSGSNANWSEDAIVGGWNAIDVALSGNTAVVGEPYSPVPAGGRVIVLTEVGGVWTNQAALLSPTLGISNAFGWRVDLEGDVLAVGEIDGDLASPNGGVVHVYERSGTTWTLVRSIAALDSAAGDDFGGALALSGADLVVGLPNDTNASGVAAGAAYFERIGASTVAYCAAGASIAGCVATMSSTGTPSATQATPFALTCSNVDGQRVGLVLYGLRVLQRAPWSSSTYLCAAPPLQRSPAQNSNGALGACDGSLNLDWNGFVAAQPGALGQPFTAGREVFAQGWYRDPLAVKTSQLSNALAFVLAP